MISKGGGPDEAGWMFEDETGDFKGFIILNHNGGWEDTWDWEIHPKGAMCPFAIYSESNTYEEAKVALAGAFPVARKMWEDATLEERTKAIEAWTEWVRWS